MYTIFPGFHFFASPYFLIPCTVVFPLVPFLSFPESVFGPYPCFRVFCLPRTPHNKTWPWPSILGTPPLPKSQISFPSWSFSPHCLFPDLYWGISFLSSWDTLSCGTVVQVISVSFCPFFVPFSPFLFLEALLHASRLIVSTWLPCPPFFYPKYIPPTAPAMATSHLLFFAFFPRLSGRPH